MRYRATIAYDGTAYHGFQRQANAVSIQQKLEEALAEIARSPVVLIGAGRTDTGVHAVGQVITFTLSWNHTPLALSNALNHHLPDDIAVLDVEVAAEDFHPRYDAVSRTYEYHLYVAEVRDPLRRNRAWHLRMPLSVDFVHEAARHLIGTHDFAVFGTPPAGENTVRTIWQAEWTVAGSEHTFTITGNAFLYRMVRHIVGTLVMVGQGKMTADEFGGILSARRSGRALPLAPAHGLILTRVKYSED
jgi:tRNA pseudouridine38-40 synthase